MSKKLLIILNLILAFPLFVTADDEDSYVRENPAIAIDSLSHTITWAEYKFLNLTANIIEYNGDDWAELYKQLNSSQDSLFSIVHIGDSHIQADFTTGETRRLLQARFGNAGRGLVIPFKLAKTNEPRDYAITSNVKWSNKKAIKSADCCDGFTGISISPMSINEFDLTISTLSKAKAEPFTHLTLFGSGDIDVDSVILKDRCATSRVDYSSDAIEINFTDTTTSVKLLMSSHAKCSIFGALLTNGSNGVLYNAIGNNGATYDTYNNLKSIERDVAVFNPNLIIVSLGANEAYSRITENEFYDSIHRLVTTLKKSNPTSKILLTTPMESQRRKYIRRKGRRRRRTYVVNERVATMRNAIINYGKEHCVAVYDWYDVAGGKGASSKWLSNKLLGRDRIHCTHSGYILQGNLLYNALIKDLNSANNE